MKKILFIHNHKDFSGAAKSLGETINRISTDNEIYIISPSGSSANFFRKFTKNVIEVFGVPRFNHFEIGHYKGFRWLLVLRELIIFLYFFFKIIILKLKFKNFDNVHLNEFELVIISPLINFFFTKNITSHLRSRLLTKKGNLRIKLLKYLCNFYIKKIVAIDHDCFETSLDKKKTEIVYNSLNINSSLMNEQNNNHRLTFGFIGNFFKRKGIYDLLLVFKKIHKLELPIDVIIAGIPIKRFFLHSILGSKINFKKFILEHKIDECKNICFIDEIHDLENFYQKIDAIIFPSYMNAVGRPVIEASLLKKPSIIGLNKYNNDTAKPECSLIFEPGNINQLFEKILFFHQNREKMIDMGHSAYVNASKLFDLDTNTKKFINILNKI